MLQGTFLYRICYYCCDECKPTLGFAVDHPRQSQLGVEAAEEAVYAAAPRVTAEGPFAVRAGGSGNRPVAVRAACLGRRNVVSEK